MSRVLTLARVVLVTSLAALLACKTAEPPTATPRTKPADPPADYEDPNPADMAKERVTRWRWSGARQDCHYVYENRCYAEKKAACKAASCPAERCTVDDGVPARIRCR
jgi:hypothetical protein